VVAEYRTIARFPVILAIGAGSFLAACVDLGPAAAPLQDHAVEIVFAGDCPAAITPAELHVRWRERIRWESVTGPQDFAVHLGPFQRQPLPSNPPQGRTLWTKVEVNPGDFDVGELEFSYSVTSRGCTTALGGRIVVR
jgi:hypothetical protein